MAEDAARSLPPWRGHGCWRLYRRVSGENQIFVRLCCRLQIDDCTGPCCQALAKTCEASGETFMHMPGLKVPDTPCEAYAGDQLTVRRRHRGSQYSSLSSFREYVDRVGRDRGRWWQSSRRSALFFAGALSDSDKPESGAPCARTTSAESNYTPEPSHLRDPVSFRALPSI